MTFHRDTASSRPARFEHGSYTFVSSADTEPDEPYSVDTLELADAHQTESFADNEATSFAVEPSLGEVALMATNLPRLVTGYAVKHGETEGRSVLL